VPQAVAEEFVGQKIVLTNLGLQTIVRDDVEVKVGPDIVGQGHRIAGLDVNADIGYEPTPRSLALAKSEMASAEYVLSGEEQLEDGYLIKGASGEDLHTLDCMRTIEGRAFVVSAFADSEERLRFGEQVCKNLSRDAASKTWFPPSITMEVGQEAGDVFAVTVTPKASPHILWLRRWSESDAEVLGRITPTPKSANDADYANRNEFLPGPTIARPIALVRHESAPVQLSGLSRNPCDEVHVQVSGTDSYEGLFVTATHDLQPRSVDSFTPGKKERAWVASIVGADNFSTTKAKDFNNFDGYRADLDGDGSVETIIEATGHVSEDDESFDFSVLLVRSQGKMAWLGFLAKPPLGYEVREEYTDAQWIGLQGIADLDGNGTMELVAMHDESWNHYHNLRVHQWKDSHLKSFTSFHWPERDCYANTDWGGGSE
jgi:hypothetical protein